ncbi:MAG: hypothetical protein LBM99_00945 [Bacillales bacterium]|jgi:predicted transcriptional regulator of viral defense system|nr:hypothetical protein [Bacillales bacterium]
MELVDRLIERYGYNEPIIIEEIFSAWNEYSKTRVYQLLNNYVSDGVLQRYDKGIYYVPTITKLGTPSHLGFRQVVEKKYIQSGEKIYGYYGGLSLLNGLGLTTQMPNTLEVVTSKESTRVREIKIRSSKLFLRRARVQVTKDNVCVLMLLEAFNVVNGVFDYDALVRVREFVKQNNISLNDVFSYAKVFPGKAIKNLLINGVENVFA